MVRSKSMQKAKRAASSPEEAPQKKDAKAEAAKVTFGDAAEASDDEGEWEDASDASDAEDDSDDEPFEGEVQKYELYPHKGVGPIRLGMKVSEVAEVMKAYPGKHDVDWEYLHREGIQLQFTEPEGDTEEPTVEIIIVSKSKEFELLYKGQNLLTADALKLVETVSAEAPYSDKTPARGCFYAFPSLEVTFFRPSVQDYEHFTVIGMGPEGYCESAADALQDGMQGLAFGDDDEDSENDSDYEEASDDDEEEGTIRSAAAQLKKAMLAQFAKMAGDADDDDDDEEEDNDEEEDEDDEEPMDPEEEEKMINEMKLHFLKKLSKVVDLPLPAEDAADAGDA